MSEEILTNEFWGIGMDPLLLETTMTAEARAYAVANDLLYSFIFDQQRGILDGLSYIAGHHNGFYTVGGGTIAHRQLEIDDEVVLWGNAPTLSDDFGDEILGNQWRRIGDALYEAVGGLSTQRMSYSEALTMEYITINYKTIDRTQPISFGESILLSIGGVSVTWNPSDKSSEYTLSNGDLTCAHSFMFYKSIRATYEFSSGKKYFEIKLDDDGGNGSGIGYYGIMESSATITSSLSDYGYGLYSGDVMEGKVVSIAYDVDGGKIWFAYDGTWVSGNPATGTSPSYSGISGDYKPALSAAANATWTANFGGQSWAHTPPSGFSGLDT
jgi:hypothetical protein